jgi:dissimilatory sulfite reductase (desulfoviridin) alpha/beta subunit
MTITEIEAFNEISKVIKVVSINFIELENGISVRDDITKGKYHFRLQHKSGKFIETYASKTACDSETLTNLFNQILIN